MSVYVFGHRNPDSDSIVGAISISYLKNQLENEEYIPARQGDISAETEFILNRFGGTLPEAQNFSSWRESIHRRLYRQGTFSR